MLKYPRDYSKFLGRVKSIDGRSDFRSLLNNGVNFINDYDDNGGFFFKKKMARRPLQTTKNSPLHIMYKIECKEERKSYIVEFW